MHSKLVPRPVTNCFNFKITSGSISSSPGAIDFSRSFRFGQTRLRICIRIENLWRISVVVYNITLRTNNARIFSISI